MAPGPFARPQGPPDLCLPPSLCSQQGGRSALLKNKSDCLCIRLKAPISTGPLVGSPCCTPALGPPQVPSPLLERQVPTRSAPSPPHASLTSDLKSHGPSQHSPARPCCFSSEAVTSTPQHPRRYLSPPPGRQNSDVLCSGLPPSYSHVF